ncbi:MAG TPA: NADH-quinone oxidoreductase subunit N [Phycisphaerae bacterium]|jgi:NADH-quinone oxidoreductase subunit N|nr:NADH-quinone oxidoreductase subunit N [Phycisphaerae bacterium]HOB73569.1 NADH-quinone oxidoreductase subunit N [Phycisphaerae bacterium]HOJ55810.1 NADH-quinone oxidoreductase subunit N [Phycisphaerae bacterium]HOL25822.1 NADH-quinone oxidoreductase subunit N [Phycisphaerae bacterium]HPP21304.1 NADH-quinone oxidoreductase subunit N [Phycisphaerae bacterium]
MMLLSLTPWIPAGLDLRMFAPELALIATIVAVLVVPLVLGRSGRTAAFISLIGALATFLLTWRAVAGQVVERGYAGLSPDPQATMLVADNFSVFFKLFLSAFLALIIGLWLLRPANGRGAAGVHGGSAGPEFFVLLLSSALGMALMVGTLNLLVMVIAIEMASLPSYALVGSDKRSRPGAEASLKYVLFGAATSSIMVYGLSLIYGAFGTLDIAGIAGKLAGQSVSLGWVPAIGFFALCVGIAFKISAVPFHFWCPDVFEGAPIEVTTWLSVASKAAGLGLLLRIVYALSTAVGGAAWLTPFAWGIGLVAAVTCTVGNLAALRQDSVKRMLAYSSIAHAGYMMMAAAIFTQAGQGQFMSIGLAAVIAYLMVYFVMNLGAFGVTALVSWRTGTDHISAFTGLGRRAPALALPMAVCLFSLIGLPPLGGFAAKWWLLLALGKAAIAAQPWLWGLVIVAVINTAISLYYYVRVIRQMYLCEDERQSAVPAPLGGVVLVNVCAVALLLLGTLLIDKLGNYSTYYASNLLVTQPTAPATATVEPSAEPVVMAPVNESK